MVSPVKYLLTFFPNKKNLTETGFYVLCLTVFLMPFPRSWSLYPLGLFLFLGLLIWLTQTMEMTKIFVEKIFYILPPVAYFILHFLYFLSDAKWTYLEDKLMFLLIPIFGLPVFSSGFFRKKLKLFFISFLSGILIICCYQLIRATFDSISFIDGSLKFNSLISPGVSRFNWIQLSSYEHPTYLAIKILWGIVLIYFVIFCFFVVIQVRDYNPDIAGYLFHLLNIAWYMAEDHIVFVCPFNIFWCVQTDNIES
jgi:hypothetical protein